MRTRILCVLLAMVLCALALGGCYTLGQRKPVAVITFSNGGTMRVRLYPEYAPKTVENFIKLAQEGYYTNSPVHRIEEYFVIQMGKAADGSAPGFTIKGEFADNGYSKNTLSHEMGTVSMARQVGTDNEYDSASTQFFITTRNHIELDGHYAAFGRLMDEPSFNTLMTISQMDINAETKEPREEIYVSSVEIQNSD